MHDIRAIRDDPQAFDAALARRGLPPESARLVEIDAKRRAIIQTLEAAQARRNAASKEIGDAKKAKDEARASALMAEVASLKDDMPEWEKEEKRVSKELDDALATIPNLPLAEVPEGADEHGNVEHHTYGAKRELKTKEGLAFAPKQHFELGEALGQMDFEAASKLSGARFVVLKQGLARLERALGQFFLDVHTGEHGYTEVNPPLLVRDDVMFGTAQLPKFRDDQFATSRPLSKNDLAFSAENFKPIFEKLMQEGQPSLKEVQQAYMDLMYRKVGELTGADLNDPTLSDRHSVPPVGYWLIPTAEVPLTNLVREAITDEAELPMRLTALTPCFRAEAGAAGRDTRGMIRQHQFTKCELVSIVTPENSHDEHERMLACAEEVLRRLDLHYRVVTLCTGDMGFASQKTYDIEVWLPGQGAFREISSCSQCGDFQARRMNARYRTKEGRKVLPLHTLNGSGVAVGRALIAVMETYQQDGGAIAVPEALKPYMGGKTLIEAKG